MAGLPKLLADLLLVDKAWLQQLSSVKVKILVLTYCKLYGEPTTKAETWQGLIQHCIHVSASVPLLTFVWYSSPSAQ